MSTQYKTIALARDIEDAFKNHLGTDSFPTGEWPRLALALAHVVEATGTTNFEATSGERWMREDDVKHLLRALSELNSAAAGLVGL